MPVSRRWLVSLSVALPLLSTGPLWADEGDGPAPSTEPAKAAAPARAAATSAPKTAAPAAEAPAAAPSVNLPTSPAALWSDFNHYVRIARPDLAQAAGNALLKSVDDQKLLDVVEAGEYADYERTLEKAANIETLKDLSTQFTQKIQNARIARAKDPQRINADIEKLSQGERPNLNATTRLRAAGQYAAPSLLATLLDEKQTKNHPYVLAAMTSIGRPMVYPLAVALPNLEPVPQGQVAQVLAEIGYPRALPYLKQVIENPKTDPTARRTAEAAYRQLAQAAGVPGNVTAAELFLTLGQNHYRAATRGSFAPGSDEAEGKSLVWTYDRAAGLVAVPVPAQIYGDVLAMRAARTALEQNPKMDAALSLWLTANLRRENRLPEGAKDLSYPDTMLPPNFYAEMAGPLRQHDVLQRALDDSDAALALDAIDALTKTAGTDALINRAGTAQPLLRALAYPDRRVRFAAAFAMANARPKSEFPGSHRVVPVLAEALRHGDARYAVVIGRDRETTNQLVATLKEMGYQATGGLTLDDVSTAVNAGSGMDLIVTNLGVDQVENLHRQAVTDYKLAAVPTVALVSKGDQIELNRRFDRDNRIRAVVDSEKLEELKAAIDQASKLTAGKPISAEESHKFALEALKQLHEIALVSGGVFNATDAQATLVAALADKRPEVVVASADVLSLLDQPEAQLAVADAALDLSRPTEMRIALLGSLSESATLQGNHLNEVQNGKLLELITTSQGDLAIAAARAHGALTLPTANVVPLITK